MLPVPVEYPVTPIIQFPRGNPPIIPSIDVVAEYRNYIPLTASLVANEVGLQAGNSNTRMFCYNLLCANGWNNIRFANATKLVLDSAMIRRLHNPNFDIVTAITDSVSDVLTLYASSLIFEFQDLRQLAPMDQQQAAQRNIVVLNNLQDQINRIYNATPAPRTNMYFGARGSDKAPEPVLEPKMNTNAIRVRKEEPVNHPKPTEIKVVPKMDKILTGEVENMDREKHSVVYYGRKISVPTEPIRQQLVDTVAVHKEVSKDPESYPHLVYQGWILDGTLQELLRTVQTKALLNKEADRNAVVYSGLVPTYILARRSEEFNPVFRELMVRLSKSNTFVDTQEVIQRFIAAAEGKTYFQELMGVVGQIDRVLTTIFQNMLSNVLEFNSIRVTSFVEDAKDAIEHISEKFGQEQRNAISKYQEVVYRMLFSELTVNSSYFKDLVEGDEELEQLNLAMIVNTYTILYYPGTSSELAYYFDNRLKDVTVQQTPLLDELLMNTLQVNKDLQAMNYVLLTQDNLRVNIYRVFTGESRFRARVM